MNLKGLKELFFVPRPSRSNLYGHDLTATPRDLIVQRRAELQFELDNEREHIAEIEAELFKTQKTYARIESAVAGMTIWLDSDAARAQR